MRRTEGREVDTGVVCVPAVFFVGVVGVGLFGVGVFFDFFELDHSCNGWESEWEKLGD